MKKRVPIIGLTLLFAVTTLLSSCITQEKCEARYPSKDSTSTVYKDVPVYIHDTIWTPYVDISFDTSSIGLPVDIEFKHTVKKGHVTGSVGISKGKLSFDCKADSLQHVVDSLVIVTYKREFKQEKSKPEIKEVAPKWAAWSAWGNVILLIAIIAILLYSRFSNWARGLFS